MKNLETDLRELLEVLYETEALAEMALRRQENSSAVRTMMNLVADKCLQLSSMVNHWDLPETGPNQASETDNLYNAITEPNSDEEDNIALAESEMEEIVAMASADPKEMPAELGAETPSSLELMTPELDPEITEDPEDVRFDPPKEYMSEESPMDTKMEAAPHDIQFIEEEDAQEDPSNLSKESMELPPPPSNRPPLLSFFTVNDRFRFRRSLFDGSNPKFLEALAMIEAVETPLQAEDYMKDDLQWDMDSPEVKLFGKIVEKYFSAIDKSRG